jgi:chromosome segregation ATPase
LNRVAARFRDHNTASTNHLATIASLEQQIQAAKRESDELARANQNLSLDSRAVHHRIDELTSLHAQALTALRATENERNDIMTMYKQLAAETKILQSSFHSLDQQRIGLENALAAAQKPQIVRPANHIAQLALQDGSPRVDALTHQLANEKQVNLELQQYIESLEAGNPKTELEKVIEQQYALIGEMDSEQARLLVELSHLKQQLSALGGLPRDNS